MIRYALFASTLAHFLLIFGLNNLNLIRSNVFDLQEPYASVLQVRFATIKQQQAMRFGSNINAKLANVDHSQPSRLEMQGKVTEQARKQPSGSNKIPLLLSGMTAPVNPNKQDTSLNSYLKPADVDISAIPLYALEINNDAAIGMMPITCYLKIFIDKNGVVKQVVNLDKGNAISTKCSEILALVEQMQFIPAKRNGAVVNSYIEVALEISS